MGRNPASRPRVGSGGGGGGGEPATQRGSAAGSDSGRLCLGTDGGRGERAGGRALLTRPCICSLSRALGDLSDIVRLAGFGRRYDDGATKGSS